MRKSSTTDRALLLLILLPAIIIANSALAGRDSTKVDSTQIEINYNDGPHIFWKNDSSAIVFYLCDNNIDSQTFNISDTIRFNGFCDDSGLEYIIPVREHVIEPYFYNDISKIFVLSDLHGEYEYFVEILFNSGIIDKNQNWIWGDGHLVIDGDVFDRGDLVTECLWLIYRLEIQAQQSGGRVHFTLGNHELMVLQADNRYVNEKYLKGIARKSRIDHVDLYGPDMELGRWLRSKPTAITINDILFVHGGIGSFMIEREFDIAKLNETVHEKIKLRSSQIAFDSTARFLFGSKGPFWYRGYHYEMENRYPQISSASVDSLLEFYGVTCIVVGHTGVDRITGLFDKRIFAVDIPFEDINGLEALLWKENRFYRVDKDGKPEPID